MSNFLILILVALFTIGAGIFQLMMPLDYLWERKKRQLLARGLAPQRSASWESGVHSGGWVLIVMGIIILILACVMLVSTSQKTNRSFDQRSRMDAGRMRFLQP